MIRGFRCFIIFVGVLGCGATPVTDTTLTAESLGSTSPAQSGSESVYDDVRAVGLKGQAFSLGDYRAHSVVVISFFATWCKPCKKEMVQLGELYEQYEKDGLMVVGVSVDDSDTQGEVAPLVRSRGYQYPIWLDTMNEASDAFNPQKSVPFTVVLKDGVIVFRHEGYVPGDEKKLEKAILEALSSADNS